MSAEDWEIFRLLREERRQRRLENMGEAALWMLELKTLCARLGLWFRCGIETHWMFGKVGSDKNRLSYWPSSRKMQRHPGTKVLERVGREKLIETLKDLAGRE